MNKDKQQKRGGFVPVGDLARDLPSVQVPVRRERAPQARHHFTRLDQVTQLVGASEADPELGSRAPRFLWTAFCEKENECVGDGSTWGPDNTIVFPGATGLLRVEWPSRSRAWTPYLLPRNSWRASTRPATSHTSTTQSPSVTGLRLYVRQLGLPTARSTAPTVLFS